MENLAPNGVRSPHIPARSELLYRLNYPGSTQYSQFLNISLLSPILNTLLAEITGPLKTIRQNSRYRINVSCYLHLLMVKLNKLKYIKSPEI